MIPCEPTFSCPPNQICDLLRLPNREWCHHRCLYASITAETSGDAIPYSLGEWIVHDQGAMKEFPLDVTALLEPDAGIGTWMRFAPDASEQTPIDHGWQIGKQSGRALVQSLRTFSDIKCLSAHTAQ
jgi:hypothetical protein